MEILNIDYNFKEMIIKALNKTDTILEASKLLGINKRTTIVWMKQYGIKKNNNYIIKSNETKENSIV